MTSQVYPNFKSNKGECQGDQDACTLSEDKCPLFGKLLKADSDDKRRIAGCGDQTGRNRTNRQSGLSAQKRNNQKSPVATTGNSLKPGNEETMFSLIEIEDKDGVQVRAVFTAFNKIQKERQDKRLPADNRPFMLRASKKDEPYGLRVYRSDQEEQLAFRLAIAYGLISI